MVLETDLSKHFEILAKFKNKTIILGDLNYEKAEDKSLILSMGLKCADIGHSTKSKEIHLKWTSLVMEEYFNQGDIEKSKDLVISMYCDRNNTDLSKSQAGFLKNICIPLYDGWCQYLQSAPIDLCLKQLQDNHNYWNENLKKRNVSKIIRLNEDNTSYNLIHIFL